jgi:hypothetical protein
MVPAMMSTDDIVNQVREIEALVRERRYGIALSMTERLEAELAKLPADDPSATLNVRQLVRSSRLLAESLTTLRARPLI